MYAKGRFVFYHADRGATLRENQNIDLDERYLSRFGQIYWDAYGKGVVEEMNDNEKREYYLEQVRTNQFSHIRSRFQSIFAANTIEEATIFATSIIPLPTHPIPIIEIFADTFYTHDTNWLDYEPINLESRLAYYRSYWWAEISNHQPKAGKNRRFPRLEIMIPLPATTGKIVHTVQ